MALTGMAEVITTMLDKFAREVTELVNTAISTIRNELSSIQKLYEMKLAELSVMVSNANNLALTNTEKLECYARQNDLVVFGIPYRFNEDLEGFFRKWCSVLGLPHKRFSAARIRRLTSAPTVGTKHPILIEFMSHTERKQFFMRYLRYNTLTLRQLGFKESNRVFITESLSPMARKLRLEAESLRKAGQLQSVSIVKGIVTVSTSHQRKMKIYTMNDLHAAINKK